MSWRDTTHREERKEGGVLGGGGEFLKTVIYLYSMRLKSSAVSIKLFQ